MPHASLGRGVSGLLALVAFVVSVGCGKKVEPDPKYPPRVTMEDVDDSLAGLVPDDRVRVPYAEDAPIRGATEPLVTIVEWSDFQCPYCGRFAETLDELVKTYPDDVRIVFMQFPLPMHPDAAGGAKAAIAAEGQGKFWGMHDRLFAHRTEMKRDDLVAHARALGLDVAAFEAALDAPETAQRLVREQALGRRLSVSGTPAFFVNGQAHAGAMDGDGLATLVEAERALARRLIDAGSKRSEVYARIMRAARPTGTNPGPRVPERAPGPAPAGDTPSP